MSLNPLLKLKRFASAPAAPTPPQQDKPPALPPAQEVISERPKLPPAPPLTPDEIQKLVNPLSRNCKHCKCHHTTVRFIFYTESPSLKGWYCFDCWAYHSKNRILPPVQPVRAVPKKVTSGKQTTA